MLELQACQVLQTRTVGDNEERVIPPGSRSDNMVGLESLRVSRVCACAQVCVSVSVRQFRLGVGRAGESNWHTDGQKDRETESSIDSEKDGGREARRQGRRQGGREAGKEGGREREHERDGDRV